MSDTVLRDLKDGVLTVTLNRPARKNAFSTEQWKACAAALDAAREDDDGLPFPVIRLIVLNTCAQVRHQPKVSFVGYQEGQLQ